jgi:hypothetical protein
MNVNEVQSVRVWTTSGTFIYEPVYEDGQPNQGEVKRALAIIKSDYPDAPDYDAAIESLTTAPPGSILDFPGGAELRAAQEASAAATEQATADRAAALALAAESPEDRKSREFHEATKAKLEARGYVPSRSVGAADEQAPPAEVFTTADL